MHDPENVNRRPPEESGQSSGGDADSIVGEEQGSFELAQAGAIEECYDNHKKSVEYLMKND
jgi:hypothetical protein